MASTSTSRSGSDRRRFHEQTGRANPQGAPPDYYPPTGNRSPDTSESVSLLKPEKVDLHVYENRAVHRTSEYEQRELIVRRGQSFKLTVQFSRAYKAETDRITIQLATVPKDFEDPAKRPDRNSAFCPLQYDGTLLRLPVRDIEAEDEDVDEEEWWKTSSMWADDISHSVSMTVTPPADAIVGRYDLYIETQNKQCADKGTYRRPFAMLFVLFNPWCEDDVVYMDDEAHRFEYVLNETGRIWQRPVSSDPGLPWNFGQFEDVCLDAALYLLDHDHLPMKARDDPAKIIRCLSAVTNANDEDGVLSGKWGGDYEGGINPSAWTGSVKILERFMQTKHSVCFGQCWVFSGIVTSLLRALGIPTRCVSNFSSGHDKNDDCKLKILWHEDGKPVNNGGDSIWTFHVWNESWFARTDLPEGYDGWQAHDGTPQESSGGIARCGPAPVKAIKEGHGHIPNDTRFIFAEVNGDRYDYILKKDGTTQFSNYSKDAIGRHISTKSVGSFRREIITDSYKYPDGSAENRAAFDRIQGRRRKPGRRPVPHQPRLPPGQPRLPPSYWETEVLIDLETPEEVHYGNDFKVRIHFRNKSKERRTVKCMMTANVSFYTGVTERELGSQLFMQNLEPRKETSVEFPILAKMYENMMKPDMIIAMYINGTVEETGQVKTDVEHFQIVQSQLELQAPATVVIAEKFHVTATFTNPLNEKLTGGSFNLEAAGVSKPLSVEHGSEVPPHGKVTCTFELRASRAGPREVVVNFSSDQVAGLSGTADIQVNPHI